LGDGETRLAISGFALTANNVTYGAFGDAMQYWNFFPAEAGWGRIPVWGFADVVESRLASVAEGRRVYGYFPMGDELVVSPGHAHAHGFTDLAPHRQPMASAYNRYLYTDVDSLYAEGREGQQMVLVPLFFTSFMLDDYVGDNECFGASAAIISSASSKTAIGTAYMLHRRPELRVVGPTSDANRAFVEKLGCYDDVVTYDAVSSLPQSDSIYVDIAGNRDIQAAIHAHLDARLAHSLIVGDTHWDHAASSDAPLAGPPPAFFFAPTQITKRVGDWGQAEVDRRVSDAWHEFSTWTDAWLQLEHSQGPDAVEATYHRVLEGRSDPRVGHICSMR
jgi:hypothetical protein